MWLKRVEIERYGGVEGLSLGDLGPGLTVVLGPNEAGKSSLTALVRHVLYGFPDRRSKERGYFVEGGARHGRLVFADDSGEWAVERIEGRGSGDVAVRTLGGVDRPALHTELTRGVSADAYRVVFGFGLADMADVVGSSDDIVARLYAAGAGVTVSPQDVRRALGSRADDLFKPSGRNPRINAAAREAAEMEKRLRELRREAEALAERRDSLAELSSSSRGALGEAESAEQKRDAFAVVVRELGRIEEKLHGIREELVEKRTSLIHARAVAEEVALDQRLLGAAPLIETLADEASVQRDRAERIVGLRQQYAALERTLSETLAAAGLDEQAAASIRADADARAGIGAWRDRLMRLELRAEEAAKSAGSASNAARADRETTTVPAAHAGPGGRAQPMVGWALVALGVAGVAAGVLADTLLLAGFAGLVVVVGAWWAIASRRSTTLPESADTQVSAVEARRLASEEARTAADASDAAGELQRAQGEWDAWRTERGLSGAESPDAVAEVLAALAKAREVRASLDEAGSSLGLELERAEGFVRRAGELSGALGQDPPVDSASALEVVARAREELKEARGLQEKVAHATETTEALAPRIAALEELERETESRARSMIEEHGFDGGLAQAEAHVATLCRAAEEARDRFTVIDRERATLAGEVRAMETENESGDLAMRLVGVREQIAALAEDYAVTKVAAALLDRAQRVYERERQPAVMKDAGRVLSTMTAGRYASVAVPIGSSAVEVFDPGARAKATEMLSTGTAEQLYLSLRIALLGTLGEVGEGLPVLMDDVFANFDPERKRGAAKAVAGLAASRQVVVFTCHPETAAVLAEAEPGLARISLDRC